MGKRWVQEDTAQQQLPEELEVAVPAWGHAVGLLKGASQSRTEQKSPGLTSAHLWLCHKPLTPLSSPGSALENPHFWG